MPLRGESIGTAYVRVLADGSGLPRSVRKEFNKSSGAFEDAGGESADHYEKGFIDHLKAHEGSGLDEALAQSLAKADVTDEFFNGKQWKRFEKNVSARFGKQGQEAADQMRLHFLQAGSLDGIEKEAERVVSKINTDFRRLNPTLDKNSRKFEENHHWLTRMGLAIDTVGEKIGRAFGKGSRNNFLNFTGSLVTNMVKVTSIIPKLLGGIGEFPAAFKAAQEAGDGLFKSAVAGFSNIGSEASGAEEATGGLLSTGIPGMVAFAAAIVLVVVALGPIAALISGITGALIAMVSTLAFAAVGAIAPLIGLLGPLALGLGVVIGSIVSLDAKTKTLIGKAIAPLKKELGELGKIARTAFVNTLFDTTKGGVQSGQFKNLDALKHALDGLAPIFRAVGRGLGDFTQEIVAGFNSSTFRRFVAAMSKFIPEAFRRLGDIARNVGGILANIFVATIPDARGFLGWLQHITGEFDRWTGSQAGRDQIREFLNHAADSASTVWHFLGQITGILATLIGSGRTTGDTIFDDLTKAAAKFKDFISPDNLAPKAPSSEQLGGVQRFQNNAPGITGPSPLEGFFKNSADVAHNIGTIAVNISKIMDDLDNPGSRKTLDLLLKFAGAGTGAAVGRIGLGLSISPLLGFIAAVPSVIHAFTRVQDVIRSVGNWIGDHNPFKKIGEWFSHLNLGGGGKGGVNAMQINMTAWIPGVITAVAHFMSRFGSILGRAPGIAGHAFGAVMGPVNNLASNIGGAFGRIASSMGSHISTGANSVVRFINGIPGRIGGLAAQFGNQAAQWSAAVLAEVSDLPQQIVDMFQGLAGRILDAIGDINIHVNFPSPPGWLSRFTATGGIFTGAQARIIGEAGPEAVVPLNRPLSQVDPSVRWLSALAQGLSVPSQGGGTAPGKSVHATINVSTPTADPVAVAREMVNQLVATAY